MTLPPLAVSAAPILRALAAGPHATLSALAVAAGRDVRNMNRDLAALTAAGLITGETLRAGIAPTPAGFAALAALARAEGPDAPDGVWLTAAELGPDPDQPRKRTGLTDADIESMAASILERHGEGLPGLITPPTVRAAPDALSPHFPIRWLIVSGERRWRGWRAATRLLTHDRDPLPADTRFFCPIFRGDAAQAAVHAAVENLQRSDLDDLEWADHFAAMAAADPALSGARIAQLLGRPGPSGERWVQERLRVARTATPQARARFVESRRRALAGEDDPDPFTWTNLRDSVKVTREPEPRSEPPIVIGLDTGSTTDLTAVAVVQNGCVIASGDARDTDDIPSFLRRLAGPGAPPPPIAGARSPTADASAEPPAAGDAHATPPVPGAASNLAVTGRPATRPAAAPPKGDIVVQGMRVAMTDLWLAAREARRQLDLVVDLPSDPAETDAVREARRTAANTLAEALMSAALYIPASAKEATAHKA